jgi:hypothetical protein
MRERAMCDVISHRGADSDGHHVADGVALGMRRLMWAMYAIELSLPWSLAPPLEL